MQENVSDIVKTCKKHGPLTIQQIKRRPSGEIRCKTCEEQSRERRKVKKYIPGVDSADDEIYDRLLLLQGNKCAICGDLEKHQKDARLIIDYHPAIKGMARGLICKDCDLIIYSCRSSPIILQRFIKYFEEVPYSNYDLSVADIT